MGVDYSAGFGYGILIENTPENSARNDNGIYEYAEAICHGTPLEYISLGCSMTDDHAILLGYVQSFSEYSSGYAAEAIDVSDKDKQYLRDIATILDLPEPGWYGGLHVG